MDMLRYLLLSTVVVNCVANDFMQLPFSEKDIVLKFRDLNDLEQQLIRKDLHSRNSMIIEMDKQNSLVKVLEKHKWIANNKYKQSIDFIENAVIDCLSSKGLFKKEYNRGTESLDRFDESKVRDKTLEDLQKEYGELVNFDVMPSDNWTVSNWNAFLLNNYIYRVLPQSNKRYEKDNNNQYQPIDIKLFGASSVDKIFAIIRELTVREHKIKDVEKIDKAIHDVKCYINALNLDKYIANFSIKYKEFAQIICTRLNQEEKDGKYQEFSYAVTERYRIDLESNNSDDGYKILGFGYNFGALNNDYFYPYGMCLKNDSLKSLIVSYYFENLLDNTYYAEDKKRIFYAYFDNATIESIDNIKYQITLNEEKREYISSQENLLNDLTFPSIQTMDDYSCLKQAKVISGDRIIDNFAPTLYQYQGEANEADKDLVNEIKNIKGYKAIQEQIKEIEFVIESITQLVHSLENAQLAINAITQVNNGDDNVDRIINYCVDSGIGVLPLIKSYLSYKFQTDTTLRDIVNNINNHDRLFEFLSQEGIKYVINDAVMLDDYNIISGLISSLHDEDSKLNQQKAQLIKQQTEIDKLFEATNVKFKEFNNKELMPLLQQQRMKFIDSDEKKTETKYSANKDEKPLVNHIHNVIAKSKDLLYNGERFSGSDLGMIEQIIQTRKFDVKEIDECINILMTSSKTPQLDGTGKAIRLLNNVKAGLTTIEKIKEQYRSVCKEAIRVKDQTKMISVEEFIDIINKKVFCSEFIKQFISFYNSPELTYKNITPAIFKAYFVYLDGLLKYTKLDKSLDQISQCGKYRTLQYKIKEKIEECEDILKSKESISEKIQQFGYDKLDKDLTDKICERVQGIKTHLENLQQDIKKIL